MGSIGSSRWPGHVVAWGTDHEICKTVLIDVAYSVDGESEAITGSSQQEAQELPAIIAGIHGHAPSA